MGDVLLTTPVIRAVKQRWPNAEIHFLTKPQFAVLVKNNPYIHLIHCYKDNFQDTIKELRSVDFDLIIDLHKNLRTTLIKSLLGIRSVSFQKLNIEKWLTVNTKANVLPKVHLVDRYFDSLRKFGIENDQAGLDYFFSDNVTHFTLELPVKYIAWIIGGNYFTKRFPSNKIVNIAHQINLPLVLVGGKDCLQEAENICKEDSSIMNFCGKTDVETSARIINSAELVISNDTGMMHLATALKKKIISIWGNTIPEFGMYPYLPSKIQNVVIQARNVECRPCSKLGFSACPKSHFKCMNAIDEQEVVSAIHQLW